MFQRSVSGDTRTYSSQGGKLQDLRYAYDGVGNIRSIESRGTGLGIEPGEFAYLAEATWGSFSADSLLRRFEYDPLYRLTRATGRERKGVEPIFWGNQVPGGSSVEEARPYIEHYSYDKTGGLVEKRHEYALDAASGVAQWKQTYQTDAASNRLVAMGLGGESRGYVWDGGGNLVQENSERHYEWDHAGRLRAFRVQAAGSPASSYGAYGYDGVGQRVQKVSIRGGVAHATVYVDGIFEHHQILDGTSAPAQANELHVMDDASRVASRRVGPDIFNAQKPAVLYELGDHLGSSSVVVSETGGLISREEYRPYGESSFGSYAKKRFRFTGKERDEESGLYYHGARYYSPWLCRWTAPDPAGMVDGVNVYAYVRGNPVRLVDPGGMQGEESQEDLITLRPGRDNESYPDRVSVSSLLVDSLRSLIDPSANVFRREGFYNQIHQPHARIDREQIAMVYKDGKVFDYSGSDSIRLLGSESGTAKKAADVARRLFFMNLEHDISAQDVIFNVHTHPSQSVYSSADILNNMRRSPAIYDQMGMGPFSGPGAGSPAMGMSILVSGDMIFALVASRETIDMVTSGQEARAEWAVRAGYEHRTTATDLRRQVSTMIDSALVTRQVLYQYYEGEFFRIDNKVDGVTHETVMNQYEQLRQSRNGSNE